MHQTILYIHQSAELYGSDKTLFYLVNGVKNKSNLDVIVVLPNDGPLRKLLEDKDIRVIFSDVIKVSRKMFTPKNMLFFPFKCFSSVRNLKKALGDVKIDIVHSNTLAVLVGAFYSKRYKIKHIWHVHEIIKKPKLISNIFPFLVDFFSTIVVFNSKATKNFLCNKRQSLNSKSQVIVNGLDRDKNVTSIFDIQKVRNELFHFNSEKDIVLALVGRINKWKGQLLLLEAFRNLKITHKNLKLVFVGSAPPNQEHFIKNLQEKINKFNLETACKIIPFQNDIWKIWDSIDIAIIPSTEPEPFGLVAVEAMLAKKPVIAANHGGLKEIVVHNKTGLLFKPNNKEDLIKKIKKLIDNKQISDSFGNKGYERAIKEFSLEKYCSSFFQIYKSDL